MDTVSSFVAGIVDYWNSAVTYGTQVHCIDGIDKGHSLSNNISTTVFGDNDPTDETLSQALINNINSGYSNHQELCQHIKKEIKKIKWTVNDYCADDPATTTVDEECNITYIIGLT